MELRKSRLSTFFMIVTLCVFVGILIYVVVKWDRKDFSKEGTFVFHSIEEDVSEIV